MTQLRIKIFHGLCFAVITGMVFLSSCAEDKNKAAAFGNDAILSDSGDTIVRPNQLFMLPGYYDSWYYDKWLSNQSWPPVFYERRDSLTLSKMISGKPIIYFYPESEMDIEVKLDYKGKLTYTYPEYNEGWRIKAFPDGTILCNNKEYYALFWEGLMENPLHISEGNVVPGSETVQFLEKSLSVLGLSRREANEFIVYWLPELGKHPYNLIHFSTLEYEQSAKLTITPAPETLIRVMMVFKPLEEPVEIKKQDISKLGKKRKGFTVVEWGGSEVPDNSFEKGI